MIFNTLYKTTANWNNGKQPKNHLSNEDSFKAFCGRKQVEWMGGTLEFKNGKWFSSDIEISERTAKETTCAYCFSSAFVMIKEQNDENKLK